MQIQFNESLYDDFTLLKLPKFLSGPGLLDQPLEIRGDAEGNAAFVTRDQTFTVRGIQNSNSLLLCNIEPSVAPGTVKIYSTLHETSEISEIVPNTDRLADLVDTGQNAPYSGDSRAYAGPTFTLDNLRDNLAASDAQIHQGLKTHRIIDLGTGGSDLRSVDPDFSVRLLGALLTLCNPDKLEEGAFANIASVDLFACLSAIDCTSRHVISQILSWYGQESVEHWRIDVSAVVRDLGARILQQQDRTRTVTVGEFTKAWKGKCPGFAEMCKAELLRGLLVVVPTTGTADFHTIRYLPASVLSKEAALRFGELFNIKNSWYPEDMIPYVDDLCVGSGEEIIKKRDALVLKYTRKLKDKDGKVTWCRRHLW